MQQIVWQPVLLQAFVQALGTLGTLGIKSLLVLTGVMFLLALLGRAHLSSCGFAPGQRRFRAFRAILVDRQASSGPAGTC